MLRDGAGGGAQRVLLQRIVPFRMMDHLQLHARVAIHDRIRLFVYRALRLQLEIRGTE